MKLIFPDYIFILTIVFFIGAHLTTNFLMGHYISEAEKIGIAAEVVREFEVNPLTRYMLGFERFKFIWSYILVPGIMTGMYWGLRKKYFNQRIVLEAFAISFFMFGLLNFLNDAAIALGVLL